MGITTPSYVVITNKMIDQTLADFAALGLNPIVIENCRRIQHRRQIRRQDEIAFGAFGIQTLAAAKRGIPCVERRLQIEIDGPPIFEHPKASIFARRIFLQKSFEFQIRKFLGAAKLKTVQIKLGRGLNKKPGQQSNRQSPAANLWRRAGRAVKSGAASRSWSIIEA